MKNVIPFLIFFPFLFSCGSHKTTENTLLPDVDTIHYHLIRPPDYFIMDTLTGSFIIWKNPRITALKKNNKVAFESINLIFEKEEEVAFTNYSKAYLQANPEGEPYAPWERYERLIIKYDILHKKHNVRYEYSPEPENKMAFEFKEYSSLHEADSILSLWGMEPIKR